METTISASFRSLQDMEHAVHALRKQGAIDIRVGIHPPHPSGPVSRIVRGHPLTNGRTEMAEEFAYTCDVYVEPSRSRQAEDTIVRYGGRFNTSLES